MIALVSFLLVILSSILIVRIGAVALEMTGLSRDIASFQAHSAFSGTGFTTSESEYVISHPVRRRIIRTLMFLGSAGITSAIATLVLTFVGKSAEEAQLSLLFLAVGLVFLFLFSRSKLIERAMKRLIKRMLSRFTSLKIYDYNQLLGLSKGYSIAEIRVRKKSWLANKTLRELQLNKEGILVLGIYRKVNGKEAFLGAPSSETKILPGDVLVCYGPEEIVFALSRRIKGISGKVEHEEAVEKARVRKMQEEMELGIKEGYT